MRADPIPAENRLHVHSLQTQGERSGQAGCRHGLTQAAAEWGQALHKTPSSGPEQSDLFSSSLSGIPQASEHL